MYEGSHAGRVQRGKLVCDHYDSCSTRSRNDPNADQLRKVVSKLVYTCSNLLPVWNSCFVYAKGTQADFDVCANNGNVSKANIEATPVAKVSSVTLRHYANTKHLLTPE